jgi:OmpA-OmpF porin, OOP family
MHAMPKRSGTMFLAVMLAAPASIAVAQQQDESNSNPNIIVNGELIPDTTAMTKGPEVKGIITARKGDKMKVTAADGTSTLIFINDATKIKSGSLFGGDSKLGASALLNGLPVTVKTMQAGPALLASQIVYRGGDFKTASMIRNGTAQGFAEQTAATQALRGRVADIDQYNVKNTTNVNFDVGKAVLSSEAQANLCAAAKEAEATNNALLLVVGYTDATGSQDFNQQLSEKRASRVVNYLQQSCGWKPYRMLTPTGMSEADPLADNQTPEGKAQNRRVAVNILVSKAADGL